MTSTQWYTLSIEEAAKKLDTDPVRGLSTREVVRRQAQFGPNELAERPRPGFLARLWNQLNQFLVLILIASAVVSAGIGWSEFSKSGEVTEFIEAAAIMAIVVLNAILGLVQEGKAEQALAALKKMSAPNATVIREGRQQVVPAVQLVPGDLVVLETGNYVPADVRLVESVNLRVEEASLTGESVPVEKTAGLGGYFAQSLDVLIEMFMIAVSLAIAAVPEGLPAVVTICLALGMQKMVKRHALIRRLPAVETLGSATAIHTQPSQADPERSMEKIAWKE